jgi:hypothetical protein
MIGRVVAYLGREISGFFQRILVPIERYYLLTWMEAIWCAEL